MVNQASNESRGQVMPNTALTANVVDGNVVITSAGTWPAHVGKGSPPQRFTFNLTDNTGLDVKFLSSPDFLSVDESGNCPPAPGINSDQIDRNSLVSSDRTAGFTDLNSRQSTLSFALHFECSDGSNPTYDPIIINGGQ